MAAPFDPEGIRALTFDLFGTVLDLGGSLTPHAARFLEGRSSEVDPADFWAQLRYRQRLEQYQDSLLELGHSGYLETVERAFSYVCRAHGFEPTPAETEAWMAAWQELSPFPEVRAALERLAGRFRLVALSNGNAPFLEHLAANRIRSDFDAIISVDLVGVFKPSPAVYRRAAQELDAEPGELLMVSANSFDILGARACGLRGAYIDRYGLPFEETQPRYQPDLVVEDFTELADALGV
jgi:2-haloacid dehalogenase